MQSTSFVYLLAVGLTEIFDFESNSGIVLSKAEYWTYILPKWNPFMNYERYLLVLTHNYSTDVYVKTGLLGSRCFQLALLSVRNDKINLALQFTFE